VLKKGGILMFSNEIIAIPDLVKLSTLSKFERGNPLYRTRDRQSLHFSFPLKCFDLEEGK